MPLTLLKDIFEKNKCIFTKTINGFDLELEGRKISVDLPHEVLHNLKSFQRSNQHSFSNEERKLLGPKSIEIGISRLNPGIQYLISKPHYVFNSPNGRKVEVSNCSDFFVLSFLRSDEYSEFFESIIAKRIKMDRIRSFYDLVWHPITISFSVPRKTDQSKLTSEGIPALEACLFKLAVESGICWEFMRKRRSKLEPDYDGFDSENLTIPLAKYDSNMLKYYKVAVSSQFPSQSYLSYYQVLEYNFLSVSDEVLHSRVKSHIHSTNFIGNNAQIERIINTIKKHNDKSDETEMLIRVLRKYTNEDELIEFMVELETKLKENIYTKPSELFGERLGIQAKPDHAISNTAKILKHIRNALVHSSDKYNRDDCHIPLTESEYIIEKYIPLIAYLAEKIIFATSS